MFGVGIPVEAGAVEAAAGSRVRAQCAAWPYAVRCDGLCSVLRWPVHRTVSFVWEYCPVWGGAAGRHVHQSLWLW